MGQASSRIEATQAVSLPASGCPVPHDSAGTLTPAKCPINHQKTAQCPVDHDPINPRNQMPALSQVRQDAQKVDLPLERTESSIPRDGSSKWEYPSPQQFFNALVRKGWETPEEHVVTMVEIHNFLNEEVWEEVKKWEKRRTKYVDFRFLVLNKSSRTIYSDDEIQLTCFKGRPGEMSPKARLYMFAGWLLPSRFK